MSLHQECRQLLRSFACTTQQVPTTANNSQHCWASNAVTWGVGRLLLLNNKLYFVRMVVFMYILQDEKNNLKLRGKSCVYRVFYLFIYFLL